MEIEELFLEDLIKEIDGQTVRDEVNNYNAGINAGIGICKEIICKMLAAEKDLMKIRFKR